MVERRGRPKPEWIIALEEHADEEFKSGVNRPTVTLPDIKTFKPKVSKRQRKFEEK